MDYYAIGQRIRKIRKARGISQEQLAEQIGISTTHMSHIETGNTKLSLPVFVDLSTTLEVRSDELLYGSTPTERGAAVESILCILDSCTTKEIKIIEEILIATKISLDKHM